MSEFSDLVKRLTEAGADPNDLQVEFEQVVKATGGWVFGGRYWHLNLVCSICGSGYGGFCHDPDTLGSPYPVGPGFHRNQPGRTMIPWNEWKRRHEAA